MPSNVGGIVGYSAANRPTIQGNLQIDGTLLQNLIILGTVHAAFSRSDSILTIDNVDIDGGSDTALYVVGASGVACIGSSNVVSGAVNLPMASFYNLDRVDVDSSFFGARDDPSLDTWPLAVNLNNVKSANASNSTFAGDIKVSKKAKISSFKNTIFGALTLDAGSDYSGDGTTHISAGTAIIAPGGLAGSSVDNSKFYFGGVVAATTDAPCDMKISLSTIEDVPDFTTCDTLDGTYCKVISSCSGVSETNTKTCAIIIQSLFAKLNRRLRAQATSKIKINAQSGADVALAIQDTTINSSSDLSSLIDLLINSGGQIKSRMTGSYLSTCNPQTGILSAPTDQGGRLNLSSANNNFVNTSQDSQYPLWAYQTTGGTVDSDSSNDVFAHSSPSASALSFEAIRGGHITHRHRGSSVVNSSGTCMGMTCDPTSQLSVSSIGSSYTTEPGEPGNPLLRSSGPAVFMSSSDTCLCDGPLCVSIDSKTATTTFQNANIKGTNTTGQSSPFVSADDDCGISFSQCKITATDQKGSLVEAHGRTTLLQNSIDYQTIASDLIKALVFETSGSNSLSNLTPTGYQAGATINRLTL